MTFDQSAWQTAEAPAQGEYDKPVPPENGTHTTMLADGSAFTSKRGNMIAKFEWQIVSTGQQWGDIHTLVKDGATNQMAMAIVKDKLLKLGVPAARVEAIDSMEALDAMMKAPVGEFFEVDFKTNGKGFTNCYIGDRLAQPKESVESVEDMFPPKESPANTADVPVGDVEAW